MAAVPGVEARAGKFPGPSLIPTLTAIQREHGWLPREELVDAVARRAPPAVRDRGADLVLPALPQRAAGGQRGRRLPRSLLLAHGRGSARRALRRRRRDRDPRGLVPRALRPARRSPSSTSDRYRARSFRRRGRAAAPERSLRGRRASATGVLSAGARRRPRREDVIAVAEGLRAARDGRRRLPDRAKWELVAGQEATPKYADLQRRRVRARDVQGPPDPGRAAAPRARGACCSGMLRDGRRGGLGLRPPRVRRPRRHVLRAELERLRERAARRRRRGPARSGRRSSPRRAATSSARSRRCWSAWRATAASRATSRRSRASTACGASRR